jgi:serine/threonine protein kinase
MANVIAVGQPVNAAERAAIAHLRLSLPDGYLLLHNFEILRDGELFEVDLAVVAPHAVYLVDVKGTHGLIDVYGSKWYPEGRQPYTSPLLKLRSHARTLKGLITESQPGRRDLESIFVDAAVLLTSQDAVIKDPSDRDAPNVTTLKAAAAYFKNSSRIPTKFSKNISPLHNMVLKGIRGAARPRSGPLRFGNWEVVERLGATSLFTEYRAINAVVGVGAGTALLRAYQADPYLPPAERASQRNRIATAYKALTHMPGHPCIVGPRDFLETEAADTYILVTEDVPGHALRLHIEKPTLVLTLDQKLRIAEDLLTALEHAHAHGIVHRNVTPSTILVGTDGRARLTGFDFARAGTDRSKTIAQLIVDELEPEYMAPELHGEPEAASAGSDVFSTGLVLYELFTGERPFGSATEAFEQEGVFPVKPSQHRGDVPVGFDDWVQSLCTLQPDERPTASQVLAGLATLRHSGHAELATVEPARPAEVPPIIDLDYERLAVGTQLTRKYVIDKRLGKRGAFGVVYKAIDTLGDVSRAIKLILRDRHSTLDRLKKEYRTLLRTPEHPLVVKVFDADLLPSGVPFIVFEYVDGIDVAEMIEIGGFALEDAVDLAKQVAQGLAHLHENGVYHCDIKPRNLIWTDRGVKIIDFNVSVLATDENGSGGGSRRYLPPDLDLSQVAQPVDLVDRDVYALGLTFYEAVTARYPWTTQQPPVGEAAQDPRTLAGLSELSPELVAVMLKAIAPKRVDRFASAREFLTALGNVNRIRKPFELAIDSTSTTSIPGLGIGAPNTNPYVDNLLTLYSQSRRSNAGTRGLDAIGEQTYVATLLDEQLVPAVLSGEFRLVLISGNAGDGKTAFLQQLEAKAKDEGATGFVALPNGRRFEFAGRVYTSNYDGSQDEGDRTSDDVIRAFLGPFAGETPDSWPHDEVRLVAINEGRLVDFLTAERERFPLLAKTVSAGLSSGAAEHGVAVVNLNLRSVVADPTGTHGSILTRLVRRMTHEKFWEPCKSCDLKDRCYAYHNARTLQDTAAGPKVIERLESLYTLTHLRGRLHITLRDLRSALAFMLVGTRDCDEIHDLYRNGKRDEIARSFYFNSWMGGGEENADRLISLLREVDVGEATDPRLDRSLDFTSPAQDRTLFRFTDRGTYDREVLARLFTDLPRDFAGKQSAQRSRAHREYVAMARRRAYFERRDSGWQGMMPYETAQDMLALVRRDPDEEVPLGDIIQAINRGEGLGDIERLGGKLALKVRNVEAGTIRSYRLFPGDRFSLDVLDVAARARFVEHMPSALALRYHGDAGSYAELVINLDVFEMLRRLNEGYRPSVEEEQGFYLSLAVFKNVLGSAPYQEVLLTTTGHDFYGIERLADGRLEMERVSTEVL